MSVRRLPLREAVFLANVDVINAHNVAGRTWTLGLNEFTDLTHREFAVGR